MAIAPAQDLIDPTGIKESELGVASGALPYIAFMDYPMLLINIAA
jgi:hypothetical protein